MYKENWIHLVNPTEAEKGDIAKRFSVSLDFINAALDRNERPRVQRRAEQLLIVAHVPLQTDDDKSMPYETVPVGIIHTPYQVVTICAVDHPLFSTPWDLEKGDNHFTLQLLREISGSYIRCLHEIDKKVAAAEERLTVAINNKQLFNMLDFNKSLIAFTKALKGNHLVIKKVTHDKEFEIHADDEKLVSDIAIETRQAIDMARIHNLNLSGLMDAYSAAIENNLSMMVQKLTMYMIIIAIPMGAAGIYGMNTPLPFQDEPYALTVIMSASVMISTLIVWILHKKRIF